MPEGSVTNWIQDLKAGKDRAAGRPINDAVSERLSTRRDT
jgi:hypothetical protein